MIYCPPFNGSKILRIDPVGLSVDVLECDVAGLESTYAGVLEDTGMARYFGAVAVDGVVSKGSSTRKMHHMYCTHAILPTPTRPSAPQVYGVPCDARHWLRIEPAPAPAQPAAPIPAPRLGARRGSQSQSSSYFASNFSGRFAALRSSGAGGGGSEQVEAREPIPQPTVTLLPLPDDVTSFFAISPLEGRASAGPVRQTGRRGQSRETDSAHRSAYVGAVVGMDNQIYAVPNKAKVVPPSRPDCKTTVSC